MIETNLYNIYNVHFKYLEELENKNKFQIDAMLSYYKLDNEFDNKGDLNHKKLVLKIFFDKKVKTQVKNLLRYQYNI